MTWRRGMMLLVRVPSRSRQALIVGRFKLFIAATDPSSAENPARGIIMSLGGMRGIKMPLPRAAGRRNCAMRPSNTAAR